MHNYGRQAGAWEGILAAFGVPLIQPYPVTWQVVLAAPRNLPGTLTREVNVRRAAAKARSLASAQKLFGVELRRSQDGIADALHLALWALHIHGMGLSTKTASMSRKVRKIR